MKYVCRVTQPPGGSSSKIFSEDVGGEEGVDVAVPKKPYRLGDWSYEKVKEMLIF